MKVLDFGIVGAARDPADTSLVHTRGNAVRGTPAFIAPEQAMGTDLDGRADIYAIGCVAYWLLTGQLVFTADTPMGLLLQHAQTPPTPPSARTDLPIPRHSMTLCCPVSQRTPRSDRSPPENCRFGWPRWKARAPGPRTGPGTGG